MMPWAAIAAWGNFIWVTMNNYYILSQQEREPRPVDGIYMHATTSTIREVLEECADDLWGVDLETRGTDASDPDSAVVGIGLASTSKVVYFDLTTISDLGQFALRQWLRSQRLVAFNVNFDGQFLKKLTGHWLNFIGDSYALFKNLASEGWPGQKWNLETAQYEILGWQVSNKDDLAAALKERGLTKADMWQLPASVLGPYCATDADSALQLWDVLAQTCEAKGFDFSLPYHQGPFLTEVRLLEEQQLRGIYVDQERLQSCHTDLLANIKSSMDAFLEHPQVAPHIARYNQEVHSAWKRAEPPRVTAKGETSKRWEAWRDREAKYMEANEFNPNSKKQLEELFYGTLGFKATKFTETGRRVVDRKVLPHLGEPGQLLNKYNLLVKQRGYVEATIAKSARDGLIHPQFNSVGTLTGRLSGTGGLNAQQMPKTPEFLYAWRARPGHKLVQLDFVALEPTLLAEFSRDKAMWEIYGPDAKPNDIYLYVAAKIPALGKDILKYYDPSNPTKEGIALAKKHCKRDRAVAKIVQLASSYGAGAKKIHETLTLAGIDITLKEVRQIHRDYWRIFSGVKRFAGELENMWAMNGGYVFNALGRPIPVAEDYIKDLLNRQIQSSGHDVLQLFIWHIDRLRQERNLPWYPWLIDMHDEVFVECPEEFAPAVAESFRDALRAVNEELGMEIQLKGDPEIVDNLAEVKCENYVDWLRDKVG